MKERRAEPRWLCSDLIEVRIEGPRPREVTANLEDVAPSGACVQLEEPIAKGTRLRLMLGQHEFRGRAVHSTRNQIGYFVGVQFDAGQKWSRQIYEPQHLLDPARVRARKSNTNA